MTTGSETSLTRSDLARQYASGAMSFRDVQARGLLRYTELLGLLADLNLQPPMARQIGPNLQTREAGMARLVEVLGQTP